MDHHCPWIANCVGYFNYKFFFLMIFYSTICLSIFSGTFWEVLQVAINHEDRSPYFCFMVMLVYSLCLMLNFIVLMFLTFHCYLLYNNYTTIEFCEKKRNGNKAYHVSPYRTSFCGSLENALGPYKCLWLIPVQTKPSDGGLNF
jgi:hypothetical protein